MDLPDLGSWPQLLSSNLNLPLTSCSACSSEHLDKAPTLAKTGGKWSKCGQWQPSRTVVSWSTRVVAANLSLVIGIQLPVAARRKLLLYFSILGDLLGSDS